MLKALFIQQLYNLSDEQLERELTDRISFRAFLGTTEIVPDSTTIWLFRERLAESGKDKDVWDELQRQLDAMKLEVKKGIMQDASFITSDPGHAKKDTPRGDVLLTEVSRSFDAVETKPRRGGAEMEPGQRREQNPISGISSMALWM